MTKKILVVDDEASVRDLLKDTFNNEGYKVRLAEGAEPAFEILKEENIKVIFLDLKLFGMNGIELCKQIKKKNPTAIIFAMTGWAALYDIEECREVGFDDFFTKPVQIDVLLKAVDDAFEKLDRWRIKYK
ncbi:MAG TPA: response regulator [Syntrophales bacterium]|nr:response regulator [Syntrophales bacterium]